MNTARAKFLWRSSFLACATLLLLVVSQARANDPADVHLAPVLERDDDVRRAYVDSILEKYPDIATGAGGYRLDASGIRDVVEKEQRLLNRLRSDEDYMQQIRLRPAPRVWRVARLSENKSKEIGLSQAWNRSVESSVLLSPSDIQERAERLSRQSTTGFFRAVAQYIPPSERRLLGEPRLATRLEQALGAIQNSGEVTVRKFLSEFRASNYGVTTEQWGFEELKSAVLALAQEEWDLAVAFEKALESKGFEASWILLTDVQAKDLMEEMRLSRTAIDALLPIRKRIETEYGGEPKEVTEIVERDVLVLREVPPRIGIYRGAVGGDCSTCSSWSIAYAPTERDWFIESQEGKVLGYVSGTLTRAVLRGSSEEVTALYVKDIVSPTLDAKVVTQIMSAMSQLVQEYGAEVLLMAPESFAGQNHIATYKHALEEFPITGFANQRYTDGNLRRKYLYSASSSAYDGANIHRSARVPLISSDDLNAFRVTEISSELPGAGWTSDFAWKQLAVGIKSGNELLSVRALQELSQLEKSTKKVQSDRIMARILNSGHLSLADYRSDVKQAFEELGIKLSSNLMRSQPDVFRFGLLNASDAFSGDQISGSMQALRDLLWWSGNPQSALPYLQKYKEVVQAHPTFKRALTTLFDNRAMRDRPIMKTLIEAGYTFEEYSESMEAIQWVSSFIENPEKRAEYLVQALKASVHQKNAIETQNAIALLLSPYIKNEVKGTEQPAFEALNAIEAWRSAETRQEPMPRDLIKEIGGTVKYEENVELRLIAAQILLSEYNRFPESIDGKLAMLSYRAVVQAQKSRDRVTQSLAERALERLSPETIQDLAVMVDQYEEKKSGKKDKKTSKKASKKSNDDECNLALTG